MQARPRMEHQVGISSWYPVSRHVLLVPRCRLLLSLLRRSLWDIYHSAFGTTVRTFTSPLSLAFPGSGVNCGPGNRSRAVVYYCISGACGLCMSRSSSRQKYQEAFQVSERHPSYFVHHGTPAMLSFFSLVMSNCD